jgi:hypothetical protein
MYFITIVFIIIGESGNLEKYKVANEYLPFYKKEACEEYIKAYESTILLSLQKSFSDYNIVLKSVEKIACENEKALSVYYNKLYI